MLSLVLCTVLSAAAQEAEEGGEESGPTVSTSFSDDFELRYWVLDDRLPEFEDLAVLNYVEQVNRLNALVTYGAWSFDTQIDEVALFANRYYLDDVLIVERPLLSPELEEPNIFPPGTSAWANVEKVRAKVEGKAGQLSLGDSYAAFGRGVALNLNRNVDIDIDTSIQGTKLLLRPGAWDITAVAGQLNRQQVFQDNPNLNLGGDLRHAVAGLRAERFGLGPANLGAHGVVYNFVTDPADRMMPLSVGPALQESVTTPVDVVIGGATAELLGVGGIDWYLEGDVLGFGPDQPAPLVEAEDDLGYAAYGSASFYPGSFVVLFEGKRYYQAERVNALLTPELYEVAIAPTLEYERVITEDSSAAVNSYDVTGGRVQVDWAAKPGELVPYASFALFRDADVDTGLHFNEVPETIYHPMLGVEWILPDAAALINLGYRVDDRDGSEAGADSQLHGDAAIKVPLVRGLHLDASLQGEWFRWGVNPIQQEDYVEIETGWTVSYHSAVAFIWYTDYTTNPLVNSTGNLSDPLYAAGELQVKPSSGVTLKAFYGAQKAGIRCSGGQCRLLPGFEGARVSFVGSF